ncbi:hypothetical protein HYZ76_01325 [Candidatus Falkowbacteria bacterium]|nr:hypothetical protein [Candidatus Falkowbacteria bacterium]
MRKSFIFLSLILIFNLLSLLATPAIVGAQDVADLITEQLEPVENVYSPDEPVTPTTFSKTIAGIIKVVLGFLGIIFLVLILYAGFMWMTSAGNEDKISSAKKTMVAAIIGAAIVLAAYAISYFVIDQLLLATKGEGLN